MIVLLQSSFHTTELAYLNELEPNSLDWNVNELEHKLELGLETHRNCIPVLIQCLQLDWVLRDYMTVLGKFSKFQAPSFTTFWDAGIASPQLQANKKCLITILWTQSWIDRNEKALLDMVPTHCALTNARIDLLRCSCSLSPRISINGQRC